MNEVRMRFDKAGMGWPHSVERWRIIHRMFSGTNVEGAASANDTTCTAVAPFAGVPHIASKAVEKLFQSTADRCVVMDELVKHKVLSRHHDKHRTYTFQSPLVAAFARSFLDGFNTIPHARFSHTGSYINFVVLLNDKTERERKTL